jgi:hypothetical protein
LTNCNPNTQLPILLIYHLEPPFYSDENTKIQLKVAYETPSQEVCKKLFRA